MNLRKQALRGSAVLTVAEMVVYGSSFVRNMILARLLTKTDFGIAATFAMIIMLLELTGKLGVARFVVRDKEGDQPEFLATAHLVQCSAGLLSSLLIAVMAWPMALLFGLKGDVTAFFYLAAIPLLQGLVHLDTRRFERDLRFGPSAMVDAIPALVTTLLAWPVGIWLADYRAVLVLLILKALLSWGASHWLAQQPYRWRMQRQYALRMLRFGWPLLVNGWLMFCMLRGDQFVVASFYAMEDFGAYAAAAALTMAPTLFFTRVFASVMLPVMAKVQDDAAAFNRRYGLAIAIISAFSVVYAVTVVIGSEELMQFVFGRKYKGTGIILACLTAVNAFRNIRLAPAISAIAKGDSVNQMISNLAGGAGLLPALWLAISGKPVWMVACSGVVGEILACSVSFVRLTRRDGVPLLQSLVPTSLVIAAVALAGVVSFLLNLHQAHPVLVLGVAGTSGCFCGGLVLVGLGHSRQELWRSWSQWRAAGWLDFLPFFRDAGTPKKPATH